MVKSHFCSYIFREIINKENLREFFAGILTHYKVVADLMRFLSCCLACFIQNKKIIYQA